MYPNSDLKAILMDMDGTLYRKSVVRKAMIMRLLRYSAVKPFRGFQSLRIIAGYRRGQEVLREKTGVQENLPDLQLKYAANFSGSEMSSVRAEVERWMEREPLEHLRRAMRPGLREFLAHCRELGLKTGVVSDYPADAKLSAMDLSGSFDVSVCAQDNEVNVFKPNPKGLIVCAERLIVSPHQAVYIGDRAEVDGVAADRAGMNCTLIGEACDGRGKYRTVTDFWALQRMLFGPGANVMSHLDPPG